MTDREQDREAFEKWARDHHYPLRPSVLKHYPIRPIGHAGQEPEYGAWDTDAAWQAWQAATSAAAERIAQLERERDEFEAHEKQTHETLGAILGTDDSLEQCALRMKRERDEARAEVDELSGRGKKRDLKPGDFFWARVRYGGKMKPKIYLDDEAIDAAMQENERER